MESKRKIERKNRKLKKAIAYVNLVKGSSSPPSQTQTEFQTITESNAREEMEERRGAEDETETSRLHINKILARYVTNHPVVDKAQLDAVKEAKRIQAEKRRQMQQSPYICLTPDEMLPFQPKSEDGIQFQLPVYPKDVQQLLLFALHGGFAKYNPRWCKLKRPGRVSSVVVITLDGVGYSDFIKDKEAFPFITQTFDSMHIEMVSPEQYGSTVDKEIYSVPMSITQIKKSNVKVAEKDRKQIAAKMKAGKALLRDSGGHQANSHEKFSRSCLLLSTHQMMQEGYPMPVQTGNKMYEDFVFTKDEYTAVTADSPLYGLDCEMCVTAARKNELTRVSLVSENGDTVYDSLVKPYTKIVNYVTRYSGITPQMMEDVNIRLEDVQRDLRDILPDNAILCGQSLNFDLLALKMFHPYVIDTSVVFNMSGNRQCKAGLRKLAGFFLNRTIQNSASGHSSVEDALASLDLVKLKLKKGLEFGDATISGTYFPDIETYFLGDEKTADDTAKTDNSNSGVVENVEESTTTNTKTNTHISLKRSLPDTHVSQSNTKALKISDQSSPTKGNPHHLKRQRLTMFNQNNSVHLSRSFFQLVDEAGRSSCIIGKNTFTAKYEAEPVEKVTVTSDKEACRFAKVAMTDRKTEFVWVTLDKYRRAISELDSTEELFKDAKQRLDDRVKKLVTESRNNSLVVLMLSGRWDANAGVFVKVKLSSSSS